MFLTNCLISSGTVAFGSNTCWSLWDPAEHARTGTRFISCFYPLRQYGLIYRMLIKYVLDWVFAVAGTT
jgi:hypothetical protein